MNWDEIESKYSGFVADGTYKVKCVGVEIKEVGSKGAVVEKFKFEDESGTQFPTADHWLSFKNDNWRVYHQLQLLLVLGADKEKAKKAIEIAEKQGTKEKIIDGYSTAFNTLLKKAPTVEIEVFKEDRGDKAYSVAEFTDGRVNMHRGEENSRSSSSRSSGSSSVLSDAEDVSDDISISLDSPF